MTNIKTYDDHVRETRERLVQLRDRAQRGDQSGWLDDLEFLLDLAMNDYDLSASDVASNVREMLTGDAFETYLPVVSAPKPPRPRPTPIGPLIRVDVYECEDDRLRVEVERVPGTDDVQGGEIGARLQDELRATTPNCPTCEREMAHVERKLRRARPATER